MPKKPATKLALIEATPLIMPAKPLPPSAAGETALARSTPKAALRRCCAAWQRAFKAYMDNESTGGLADKIFASQEAGEAYRNAMPMLAGYEGVRDFIACATHGILIGAIPPDKSGQLLYAAQVALATVNCEPRSPRSPSA
jgi:hypothetical protein